MRFVSQADTVDPHLSYVPDSSEASPCCRSSEHTGVKTVCCAVKQNFVLFLTSKCVVLSKLFVSFCKMDAVEICLTIPPQRVRIRVKENNVCKNSTLSGKSEVCGCCFVPFTRCRLAWSRSFSPRA